MPDERAQSATLAALAYAAVKARLQPDGALVPPALFRLLLDLFMADDTHTAQPGDVNAPSNSTVWNLFDQLEVYLNAESRARGFDSWVEAFHQFKVAP
jgi:hypothetical protein